MNGTYGFFQQQAHTYLIYVDNSTINPFTHITEAPTIFRILNDG